MYSCATETKLTSNVNIVFHPNIFEKSYMVRISIKFCTKVCILFLKKQKFFGDKRLLFPKIKGRIFFLSPNGTKRERFYHKKIFVFSKTNTYFCSEFNGNSNHVIFFKKHCDEKMIVTLPVSLISVAHGYIIHIYNFLDKVLSTQLKLSE